MRMPSFNTSLKHRQHEHLPAASLYGRMYLTGQGMLKLVSMPAWQCIEGTHMSKPACDLAHACCEHLRPANYAYR
eukprot:1157337-Pelagomonas_calceolata.AAC.4